MQKPFHALLLGCNCCHSDFGYACFEAHHHVCFAVPFLPKRFYPTHEVVNNTRTYVIEFSRSVCLLPWLPCLRRCLVRPLLVVGPPFE